jgi:hypothetical protein
MNDIEAFGLSYGSAEPGTWSERLVEKLGAFESGRRLVESTGAGLFDSGFFSIASVREDVDRLGGWERWLPDGAFWYAASAFGMLYVAAPDGCMWLVNSQIGSVMPTAFPLDEALARAAEPSTGDELLMRPLFRQWLDGHGPLPSGTLLASSPPVIEAGAWSVDLFSPLPSAEFLESTANLFEPVGATPISLMEPGR